MSGCLGLELMEAARKTASDLRDYADELEHELAEARAEIARLKSAVPKT